MYWQPTLPGLPAGNSTDFIILQKSAVCLFSLLCLPTIIISGTVLVSMRWYRYIRRFGFGHILCLMGCSVSASIYGIIFSELILNGHIEAGYIILQFFRWMTIFTTCSLISFHIVINRACTHIDASQRSFLSKLFPWASDNWHMVFTVMALSICYTPVAILYCMAPRNYNYPTGMPLFVPMTLDLIFYLSLVSMWFYYALNNYRNLTEQYRKYANFWPNLIMIVISLMVVLPRIMLDGFVGETTEEDWAKTEMIFVFMATLAHHVFVYIWAGVPFYYILIGRGNELKYSGVKLYIFKSPDESEDSKPQTKPEVQPDIENQTDIAQFWSDAFLERKDSSSTHREVSTFSYLPKTWTILLDGYRSFLEEIRNDCELLNGDIVFVDLAKEIKLLEIGNEKIRDEYQNKNYGRSYLACLTDLIASNDQAQIVIHFPEISGVREALKRAKAGCL